MNDAVYPRGEPFVVWWDGVMFGYHDDIIEQYPSIRAGLVHATGLANGPSSAPLLEEYRSEQEAVAARLAGAAIAEVPSIAAWRRVFTRFGAKPTQHRSAIEALLRRLTKQGDIPSLSALIDIGNLVSIRYAMPVAVFDLAGVTGHLDVRFASGAEQFTNLGSTEAVNPEPGEVIFVDSGNVVSARRWCWRQSAQSASRTTTSEALVVIEGHHDDAEKEIGSALADVTTLLASHQPQSRTTSFELSPGRTCVGNPS